MRSDGDELVCACCLLPADAVRRGVLADWLREHDDAAMADAVGGAGGADLIRRTSALADRLAVLPAVRVLFAAWATPIEEPTDGIPWVDSRRRYRPWPDVRWAVGMAGN